MAFEKEHCYPANEVWGKVMFLHLSVSHSVHGGVVSAPFHAGIHPPRQTPPPPPHTDTPLPLAYYGIQQQASGTHSTEMHT